LLDAVLKKFGIIPNLFRLGALSPNTLAGLLSLNEANSKSLDTKTRSRIAIAVAHVNGCDYCLSAHTYIGTNLAKLTAEDAALNRKGPSTDARAGAAVRFAAKVAELRGKVTDRRRSSDRFTAAEAEFIAARDSFYMATVSETGWPYVQHRGGPTGFLRV